MNVTIPSTALPLQRRWGCSQPSWMDEQLTQLGRAAVRFCTFTSGLAGAAAVNQGAIAAHHQRLTKTAHKQISGLRDAPFADGHLSSNNPERCIHGSGELPNDKATAITSPPPTLSFQLHMLRASSPATSTILLR
ncbi:MAG: hypothetical protein AAF622_13915 [Cyanobacteria bacterium P01_C01_bin.147]